MKSSKENEQTVTTTMSKAYQITVPSIVRKALGLMPGDSVDLKVEKGRAILRKAETREEQVKAMLEEFDQLNKQHRKRMTPEQKKFAKMAAGWTVNQYHEYFDSLPEAKAYIKEKYGVSV